MARQLASERLSLVCDTKSLTPFEIFDMYFKCCQMDFSKVLVNGLWLARIFLIVDEGLHAMAKFGTETFLSFGWTGNN